MKKAAPFLRRDDKQTINTVGLYPTASNLRPAGIYLLPVVYLGYDKKPRLSFVVMHIIKEVFLFHHVGDDKQTINTRRSLPHGVYLRPGIYLLPVV